MPSITRTSTLDDKAGVGALPGPISAFCNCCNCQPAFWSERVCG